MLKQRRQAFRTGKVQTTHLQQLFLGIAKNLAQPSVRARPFPVQGQMPNPNGCLLEGSPESLLAFAQPRLVLAEAQHRFDACCQDVLILRPVKIAVRAVIQTARFGVVVQPPGKQEEHGKMRRPRLLPDLGA